MSAVTHLPHLVPAMRMPGPPGRRRERAVTPASQAACMLIGRYTALGALLLYRHVQSTFGTIESCGICRALSRATDLFLEDNIPILLPSHHKIRQDYPLLSIIHYQTRPCHSSAVAIRAPCRRLRGWASRGGIAPFFFGRACRTSAACAKPAEVGVTTRRAARRLQRAAAA